VAIVGSRQSSANRRLVWLEPTLLNTEDLALAVRVLAVRVGARRHLWAAAEHRRLPKLAGQPLWPVAPVGSSFGMHPAIEITLHLDRIRAAQRRVPAAVGAAFRALTYGTNLLPSTRLAKRIAAVK